MIRHQLKVIKTALLRSHERTEPKRLKNLEKEIIRDTILKKPILVDEKTYLVIDGHHRLAVLSKLGIKKIPVILVNYFNPKIKVKSWDNRKRLDKNIIMKAGLSGKLLPPKTSKHMLLIAGKLIHVEILQKEVNAKLKELLRQ